MNNNFKLIFPILIFLSSLNSQTLNGDWVLSKESNFKQISKSGREHINREAKPILEAFLSKIDINTLSWTRWYDCTKSVNESKYNRLKDQGWDTFNAYANATETRCQTEIMNGIDLSKSFDQENKKGKKLNIILEKKQTTWEEYREYHGGYLEVAEKGLSKENIKEYKIEKKLSDRLEFTGNNTFTINSYWVRSNGEKVSDEVKKYYNLPSEEQPLSGKIVMPTISSIDLYKMVKYWKISKKRSTTYIGPEVKFVLDGSGKSFKVPLWMIDDHNYPKTGEQYSTILREMTSDILKSNPSYRPYRASKKDLIEFYSIVEKDMILLMVSYMNEPLYGDEQKQVSSMDGLHDGLVLKEKIFLTFFTKILQDLGKNKTLTVDQKIEKYNAIIDSIPNARSFINNAKPENLQYSAFMKSDFKNGSIMFSPESIYKNAKWYLKISVMNDDKRYDEKGIRKKFEEWGPQGQAPSWWFSYVTEIRSAILKGTYVKKTKFGGDVGDWELRRKKNSDLFVRYFVDTLSPLGNSKLDYLLDKQSSSPGLYKDISYYYIIKAKGSDEEKYLGSWEEVVEKAKDSPLVEISESTMASVKEVSNSSTNLTKTVAIEISNIDYKYYLVEFVNEYFNEVNETTISDEDLHNKLLAFFKQNRSKGNNASGWETFRKNQDRKAAGISDDRYSEIKKDLGKRDYEDIIADHIFRTRKGQEIWMSLGFPYVQW